MEQILSSFVAMHTKKSYKGYDKTQLFRKTTAKLKTFYRVYNDLAIFNSIPNTYEELNSLFIFLKSKNIFLKEQTNDKFLLIYIENYLTLSTDLNDYIKKINSKVLDYNIFTSRVNNFILLVNQLLKNDIKLISNKIINHTKQVFIGIRFTKEYKLVAATINEAILMCNLIPRKIDEIIHNENIDKILYREMDQSDFGIFELTSENKNVYYETGYLDGKGKETILIVKDGIKVPFDLDHKSRIIYKDLKDLKQQLVKKVNYIKKKIY